MNESETLVRNPVLRLMRQAEVNAMLAAHKLGDWTASNGNQVWTAHCIYCDASVRIDNQKVGGTLYVLACQ